MFLDAMRIIAAAIKGDELNNLSHGELTSRYGLNRRPSWVYERERQSLDVLDDTQV